MSDQNVNVESRVAALEARVARLEAAAPAGAPASTHVHYHVGYPPVGMPPCACGFASHSIQDDSQAAPTPADFSKLGE